jgi:hypothetical protein
MTSSHFPGSWPFLRRTRPGVRVKNWAKFPRQSTKLSMMSNFLWPIAGVSTGHLSRQNTHRARPSRVLRALSGLNASIRNAGSPDENPMMHPSAEGAARRPFTRRPKGSTPPYGLDPTRTFRNVWLAWRQFRLFDIPVYRITSQTHRRPFFRCAVRPFTARQKQSR